MERSLRVARYSYEICPEVIEHYCGGGGKIDVKVDERAVVYLGRAIGKREKEGCDDNSREHSKKSENYCGRDSRENCLSGFLSYALADQSGDNYLCTHGNSKREVYDKAYYRGCRSDGGNGVVVCDLTQHHNIHGIEERLDKRYE